MKAIYSSVSVISFFSTPRSLTTHGKYYHERWTYCKDYILRMWQRKLNEWTRRTRNGDMPLTLINPRLCNVHTTMVNDVTKWTHSSRACVPELSNAFRFDLVLNVLWQVCPKVDAYTIWPYLIIFAQFRLLWIELVSLYMCKCVKPIR